MKRAAVFFDRDNTLIANDGYLGDPNGVVLIDGAADAIARAREMGHAVVVFSNQSGVARGMFTEEAVHAVNHRLDEMLLDENAHAVIDRHEFCPFHPEATVERYRQDSDLRKPKPGMILQAERQLALDLSRSWVIGDAARDMDAGKAAGCRTILVRIASLPSSPATMSIGSTTPDFEVASLREAMDVIAQNPAPGAAPARAEAEEQSSGDVSTHEETAEAVKPAVKPAVGADAINEEAPRSESAASRNSMTESETLDNDAPLPPRGKSRQEILLGQILDELRRRNEQPADEFSVSKLMAGVVLVLAMACVLWAYIIHEKDPINASLTMLVAVFLQTFTIALLIMGRQK
jgi:D-glycero-D-manno-heptose 1,7-bisphosphate phosphatase